MQNEFITTQYDGQVCAIWKRQMAILRDILPMYRDAQRIFDLKPTKVYPNVGLNIRRCGQSDGKTKDCFFMRGLPYEQIENDYAQPL